ncbi:MAG TPA: hypothetical protein VK670_11020 [Silvibacterium sp.]|nr:hypothetical protein [Silvibacterium sp.]
MSAPRLILKQPTGWFAAGREVAQAMALLSDGAFKLYLHLCLRAERHTGRVALNAAGWTQSLGKDPAWIEACLAELYRNYVCQGGGGGVEICDRFWPYEKQLGGAAADPEAEFVREVRAVFLKPACVRSVFTAADEKLALNLYRSQASLEQVRRAIWLGCARKYAAMLNGQTRQPITSLAYFASLIEEVRQPRIPASYWDHVRRRMEEMEKRWLQTVDRRQAAVAMTEPPVSETL